MAEKRGHKIPPQYSGYGLAKWLIDHGVRETWLAKKMGYSTAAVSQVCTGKRNATEAFRYRASQVVKEPQKTLFELIPEQYVEELRRDGLEGAPSVSKHLKAARTEREKLAVPA